MRRILLIISLLAGLSQPCGALEITFKQDSFVDAPVVKLGDIADFDENTEMVRALASKPVGQSPQPGENFSLNSLNIKQYFASSQSLPQDTLWTGSPTVTVHRRGLNIGSDKIQSIISEFLEKNKRILPDAEIKFIPNSLPLPFILPTGELSYEVIPSNPSILQSSRFSIIFRINNKVVKNMSVRGEVEALARVVISATSLKRDQIIEPEMVSLEVMDIAKIADPGLDQEDFIGKKLKRSLRAGSPILSSMVESPPIVRRGERVKIVITLGQMLLTATGLAHSDGKQNQMIRVQNLSSHKTVYCRVTAPGLVEVML